MGRSARPLSGGEYYRWSHRSVQLQTASDLWVHSFPNASLPPECRDTFSCGRLGSEMMEGKTISEGGINVVAMVPVVKGVLLLVTGKWYGIIVELHLGQCIILSVLFVPHISYFICATSESSVSFKLLELQITYNNRSEIQQAWLVNSGIDLSFSRTPMLFLVDLGDTHYDLYQVLIALNRMYKFSLSVKSLDELQNPIRRRIMRFESTPSAGRYLVEEQNCDPYCLNDDGITPLHFACQTGHLDMIKYLIQKYRCDPHCQSLVQEAPLHSTVHLHILKYLVEEQNCSPSCNNNHGYTPLYYASSRGNLAVTRYLIKEQHCDPSSPKDHGWTTLHVACAHGHLNIIIFY